MIPQMDCWAHGRGEAQRGRVIFPGLLSFKVAEPGLSPRQCEPVRRFWGFPYPSDVKRLSLVLQVSLKFQRECEERKHHSEEDSRLGQVELKFSQEKRDISRRKGWSGGIARQRLQLEPRWEGGELETRGEPEVDHVAVAQASNRQKLREDKDQVSPLPCHTPLPTWGLGHHRHWTHICRIN